MYTVEIHCDNDDDGRKKIAAQLASRACSAMQLH